MRFLVDAPLSPELAAWLKQKGHDAVHVIELGLARASDAEIMTLARRETRVVVTADLDFPRLLALAEATGPGVLLLRGGNYTEEEARERIGRALEIVRHEEMPHSIVVIEKNRIRRRRLPIEPSSQGT